MYSYYERSGSVFAMVRSDNLHRSVANLDKAMRAELRLQDGAETDLRKADFQFWIPDSQPYVRISSWGPSMKEVYTDIKYSNRCEPETISKFLDYAASRLDIWASAWVEWEHSFISFTQLVNIEDPMIETGMVEFAMSHLAQVDSPAWLQENARASLSQLMSVWGLSEELLPNAPTGKTQRTEIDGTVIHVSSSEMDATAAHSVTISRPGDYVREMGAKFLSAVDAQVAKFGPPDRCAISVSERPKRVEVGQAFCREIAPRWDISFFGEYAKGFEPCDRPEQLEFEQRYPVLRRIRERKHNKQTYEFLDLQVTVVHPPEEDSYLLLHTQRDHEFLKTIAASAGLEIAEFGTKDLHQTHPLPDAK